MMHGMSTATVSLLPGSQHARLREVFEKQRETALRLRTSTAAQRVAKLKKLRDAVFARPETWYDAAHADFKKPPGEVDLGELLPIALELNDAISHTARWVKPVRVPTPLVMAGTSGHLKYEPKGRCLILSPWNYPVNLTFVPLVSAIAAGNTAILKPSEMTPNLSAAMAKLVKDVFPEDEVALFEGDASTAQALLELPFDHIFFTGSPAIGKVVMAAAAKHLATVTLELGGKSPTIVDETADVDLAAQNVIWGKCANAGQTCIAPDHVYVHQKVYDRFVTKCRAALDKAYGTKDDMSPHYARIVNARHTVRLKGLLDDAKAKGAKVLAGDRVSEKDCFIAPTLLEGAPQDSRIMQEEIFGPLLPLIPFTQLDEVLSRINADPKPLALYLYARDEGVVKRVLDETSSGGAVVNHSLVQYLHHGLPFGGVNNSGHGSAHGFFGFKAFSHERAVVKAQLKVAKLLLPGEFPSAARKALQRVWKLV